MKIIVKVLKGDECQIEVSENNTILEVKHKIEAALNIPVSHQKLLQIGRTLTDSKTISACNIKDGSKLTLVVKKPDALKDAIFKSFRKFYTEQQSEKLTKEFMNDFEKRMKMYSLDDLERMASGYLQDERFCQCE